MNTQGVVATKLSVTKSDKPILRSLTFTVKPGKLVGLIGPSGSGKTTLMRVIIGVQIPTKGNMVVDGVPVGDSVLRQHIGYVTQDPSVYNDLTVRQNLKYFGSLVGAPDQNVDEVINHVDLRPQRNQVVSTLSGGQKARVSLAVALLGDPHVLILDEPTVGLDPVLRRSLWALFRGLAQAGKTIIVSSHVMDEAELCDDILLMRDGRLLWQESRKKLLENTKKRSVEAAFLHLIGGNK